MWAASRTWTPPVQTCIGAWFECICNVCECDCLQEAELILDGQFAEWRSLNQGKSTVNFTDEVVLILTHAAEWCYVNGALKRRRD